MNDGWRCFSLSKDVTTATLKTERSASSRVKHERILCILCLCRISTQRSSQTTKKIKNKKSETENGSKVGCAGSVLTDQHDVFTLVVNITVFFLFLFPSSFHNNVPLKKLQPGFLLLGGSQAAKALCCVNKLKYLVLICKMRGFHFHFFFWNVGGRQLGYKRLEKQTNNFNALCAAKLETSLSFPHNAALPSSFEAEWNTTPRGPLSDASLIVLLCELREFTWKMVKSVVWSRLSGAARLGKPSAALSAHHWSRDE